MCIFNAENEVVANIRYMAPDTAHWYHGYTKSMDRGSVQYPALKKLMQTESLFLHGRFCDRQRLECIIF